MDDSATERPDGHLAPPGRGQAGEQASLQDGAAVLQVDGWTFAYPGRLLLSQWSVRVLPGVSLLQGGDGAGKTTVLRLMGGALRAQAGTARLRGRPLGQAVAGDVFWLEPRSVQRDGPSAAELFAQWPGRCPLWNADALARHVDGFGLEGHLHKPMEQLSTGSQRKVWMAAALASGAALTLIDEPVAGLDKPSISYLQHALAQEAAQARRSGRAIVVAHYEPLPGVPLRDTWVLPD